MPGFELFGDAERNEVQDVLNSGVLMRYGFEGIRQGHWKAKDLETAIEKRFKIKHAQLVSSGTAAVSMALAASGVGAGDEVIMPCFTFVASFEAILMMGATPVVVDIDDSLTLDIEAVKAAITPKTKAIMPVHMCGSMANLDALKSICKDNALLLIEDACQAIGGTYKGQALGTIGDLGCFSFDFVKTVTCGEGGVVITNNTKYAQHLDHYSDHGHDHIGQDRGAETHPFWGYNFRISELNAAVGLAQFLRIDEFLSLQKKHYEILRNALEPLDGVRFRTVPKGGVESYAFLNFFLEDIETAKAVIKAFRDNGIDVCFHYFDNNWHYIRKWEHLKGKKSLYPLSPSIQAGLKHLKTKDFSKSDHFIGRNISCLIKLSWSEAQVKQRAKTMADCIRKVCSSI